MAYTSPVTPQVTSIPQAAQGQPPGFNNTGTAAGFIPFV